MSVWWPTKDDLAWAAKVLRESGKPKMTVGDLKAARWVMADSPTPENPNNKVQYLAIRLLFIKPKLFSRTTMLWEVIREGDESGNTFMIKDMWCERNNDDFHQKLAKGFYFAEATAETK
ncbi:uncharacterized protein FIBRA_07623 [Fibroporia radiculosa]|uniref:Uncharacterized protein n=1 Tax=Fibroporia radiculosa TaxID=599839 RepID=J4IBX2_9APHY|nr:uncharacterized protein FIBRA_07623 [Fibroporia radiculosa]CCM05406.1 predicted protein [Fibroporia radiculosa]